MELIPPAISGNYPPGRVQPRMTKAGNNGLSPAGCGEASQAAQTGSLRR
jgi:hypothetical protein